MTTLQFASRPLVRLTRRGASAIDSPVDVAAARIAFERQHAVHLPELLDRDLLHFVQRQIEIDGFRERVHDALPDRPVDLVLNPSCASAALLLAANDVAFLELARLVTGRAEIQSFLGTIHRRLSHAAHACAWHDDLVDGRVAALTINLGPEPYQGGVLQIRREADGEIVYEHAVTGAGDAILFKLDPAIEHRVTEPTGRAARTVFTGWFRTEPVRELFAMTAAG